MLTRLLKIATFRQSPLIGSLFSRFIIDFLFVENGKDVYLHGENNSSPFGSVFFLLLDGARQYSVQETSCRAATWPHFMRD